MGCVENPICPGAENHYLWQDCQIILSVFAAVFLRAQESKMDCKFLSAADALLPYMLYCLVLMLDLLWSYRYSILTKCYLSDKLGVFLRKTASTYFPFAVQGASLFLVLEIENLLWKTTCARSSICLPCQCKNAAAGSALLHYTCAAEGTERKGYKGF